MFELSTSFVMCAFSIIMCVRLSAVSGDNERRTIEHRRRRRQAAAASRREVESRLNHHQSVNQRWVFSWSFSLFFGSSWVVCRFQPIFAIASVDSLSVSPLSMSFVEFCPFCRVLLLFVEFFAFFLRKLELFSRLLVSLRFFVCFVQFSFFSLTFHLFSNEFLFAIFSTFSKKNFSLSFHKRCSTPSLFQYHPLIFHMTLNWHTQTKIHSIKRTRTNALCTVSNR